MPLSLDEGTTAVRLARRSLEAYLAGERMRPAKLEEVFSELRGVFVTINSTGEGAEKLRGCIGFPYPVKPLGEAIREAAVAAATEDPRFPPVSESELNSVVLEVSILTKPLIIKVQRPQDLPSRVRIGTDGLIVSRHGLSGLLLPQVATDFGMDQTEFLSQTCMKAGLSPDAWLDAGTEVQSFQAEIFTEESPGGAVVSVNPTGS